MTKQELLEEVKIGDILYLKNLGYRMIMAYEVTDIDKEKCILYLKYTKGPKKGKSKIMKNYMQIKRDIHELLY